MIRAAAVALGGLLGLALVHCAGPRASGTKTNWFLKCDRNTDCGQELSCTCGLCTLPCATDAECEEGICSTLLEASAQCDAEPAARLCLPESNLTCSTFEVAADAELGVALTPACAMDGALVCEGFDQPVSGEYSTWYQDDMTAAVQDCEVARGEGALHYRSAAPGQSQTRIRLPAEVSSGPIHARFFLRLGADMVLPEQLQVLELWDREDGTVPDRIAVFLSADGVPRVFLGASETTLEPVAPAPLPRDTWLCLELSVDVQAEDGAASLEVDGAEVLSGSGFAIQPAEPISVVVVEAQPTTDTQGVDVYLDALVVATAPIGCQ